jgi:hypothetical protein
MLSSKAKNKHGSEKQCRKVKRKWVAGGNDGVNNYQAMAGVNCTLARRCGIASSAAASSAKRIGCAGNRHDVLAAPAAWRATLPLRNDRW